MDINQYVDTLCREASAARRVCAKLTATEKSQLLKDIASELIHNAPTILVENAKDLANAKANNVTDALYDRLLLNEKRISSMADSVLEIASYDDPVGRVEKIVKRPSGIRVGQMRVPIGVVMVIFESRPNVIIDIASLCLKSGNVAILRGGSEAINTNKILHQVVRQVLAKHNLPLAMVTFVDNNDHAVLPVILKQKKYIDIVIPRGGSKLIELVTENSTIPVIKHDKGVCHIFIDKSAEKNMSEAISINAKVQRPGVCNSMETLLIHQDYPYKVELLKAILAQGVELRGCSRIKDLLPSEIKDASELDWDTEYLDLILSVKIVNDIDEAMDHIARYSSGHSEAIITADYFNSERFLREVDSAAVLVNASTRFHDGGEFGLGSEVGISTQKLHARGAMGIEGLTCLKYIVYGEGEVRT